MLPGETQGFGLWLKDNPVEWLVKDQAYLLQGPLCHPEQMGCILEEAGQYDRLCHQAKGREGQSLGNGGVVRLFEIVHYQAIKWAYDQEIGGLTGPLGETYHFLMPTEEREDGSVVEGSTDK